MNEGVVVYYREGGLVNLDPGFKKNYNPPPLATRKKLQPPLCYLPRGIGVGEFKDLKMQLDVGSEPTL